MINATLCTTNRLEPWGAVVPFETDGINWTTKLDTKYSHFKNLRVIPNAVIVYKDENRELILKTRASLGDLSGTAGLVTVTFNIEWLRVVESTAIKEITNQEEIAKFLSKIV